jgi:hypothetical protein
MNRAAEKDYAANVSNIITAMANYLVVCFQQKWNAHMIDPLNVSYNVIDNILERLYLKKCNFHQGSVNI